MADAKRQLRCQSIKMTKKTILAWDRTTPLYFVITNSIPHSCPRCGRNLQYSGTKYAPGVEVKPFRLISLHNAIYIIICHNLQKRRDFLFSLAVTGVLHYINKERFFLCMLPGTHKNSASKPCPRRICCGEVMHYACSSPAAHDPTQTCGSFPAPQSSFGAGVQGQTAVEGVTSA